MMINDIDLCIEIYDLNEIDTLIGHPIPYYFKRINCRRPDAVQSKLFVFILLLKDFVKLLL